ncbi:MULTISPECIES: terminase small subunit [unclassified Acidovorax]|uniref:terminase small subunit n=1 Tax=unclassified Acidovorax TaxID=2684926 RepID=UPI001C48EEAC|nr:MULTISPECIES: terminase small subunit [unclassified Acidovorax]MBV7460617.1 terminase small subunit [Acidovorax sp. sif0632]MBV7465642.1 terminase small subunit [Acidovorax sp. sif0613]
METGNRENFSSVPSAKKGRTAAPAKVIDWVGVEKAYCGTRQSTRDIGKAFGISHTMVAKHAAAKGWVRPSKDQISDPTPRKGKAELEPRQERFVQEYLIDLNGTQAYMRAEPGTTEKSARTLASRMLAKVNVQKRIAAERSKTAAKLELTRERVLAEYTKLAFFDMRQAYHDSGALKLPRELDEDTAAAIAGYETVEMDGGGKDAPPLQVRKVKWADKRAALDSIMKAQGWNKSDVGTAENPLVIRDMTDAERAVRMSAILQANPTLVTALAALMAGGAQP